jgi:hypothetical protein
MRRMRSLFLIFIALWLPLQAAAGWTMSLCSHALQEDAAATVHCHEQEETAAASNLECDNCGICHLASTGFLLAGLETASLPVTANVLVPGQVNPAPSHISPPPQQPPRR